MSERIFHLVGGLPFGGGVIVVMWQSIHWLITGLWVPLTAWSALLYLGAPYPVTGWVGLNVILQNTPLSLVAFVGAGLWILSLGLTVAAFEKQCSPRQNFDDL